METKASISTISPRVDEITAGKAFEASDHIDKFATLDNPAPLPATLFSSALLDGIYPKIALTLQGTDTGLKIQALRETNELLHRSVNVVHIDKHGRPVSLGPRISYGAFSAICVCRRICGFANDLV